MTRPFVRAAVLVAATACLTPLNWSAGPTVPQGPSQPAPVVQLSLGLAPSGSYNTPPIRPARPSLTSGERIVLPANLPLLLSSSRRGPVRSEGPGNETAVLDAADFGANGASPADQTLLLQRIIDEAERTGAALYLAAGTYVISHPLLLRGIELRGAGVATVIQQTRNSNGINLLSGGRVRDIVLRGTGVEVPAHGINMGSTVDAAVEGCTIEAWGGKGINTGGNSTGNLIRGNVIVDNLDEGIFVGQNSSDNVIEDNLIARNAYNGIDINSAGNTIRGNLLYDNGNRPGVHYSSASDRHGLLIASLAGEATDHNLVEDNVLYRNYVHGILLQSFPKSQNLGNRIIRNVADANGTSGSGYGDGITIDGSAGGEIGGNVLSDNLVRGNERYGILVDSSRGDQIVKNVVENNGPAQGGGGILLRHLTRDALVSSNTTVNNSGPAIQVMPGTRDVIVADNDRLEDATRDQSPSPIPVPDTAEVARSSRKTSQWWAHPLRPLRR